MKKMIVLLFGMLVVLSACSPVQASTQAILPTTSSTENLQPTVTETTLPTSEAAETPTPISTEVTAITRPNLSAITLENASQLIDLSVVIGDGELLEVKASPDGKWLAYASTIGFKLLEPETMSEKIFVTSTSAVNSIDFSPDSSLLVAGLENGTISRFMKPKLYRKVPMNLRK